MRLSSVLSIEIKELEGECLIKKWMISLAKQGKFKVGVVPADGLGCLQLKTILKLFLYFQWASLARPAGANPMNFCPIWLSCLHKFILLLPSYYISMVLRHFFASVFFCGKEIAFLCCHFRFRHYNLDWQVKGPQTGGCNP
jgi:hypothetical protein